MIPLHLLKLKWRVIQNCYENHLRSEQALSEEEDTMSTYFPSFLCCFIWDQTPVSPPGCNIPRIILEIELSKYSNRPFPKCVREAAHVSGSEGFNTWIWFEMFLYFLLLTWEIYVSIWLKISRLSTASCSLKEKKKKGKEEVSISLNRVWQLSSPCL